MCCFEIEKIENEIKLKEDSLARYGMAIENLKKSEKVLTDTRINDNITELSAMATK